MASQKSHIPVLIHSKSVPNLTAGYSEKDAINKKTNVKETQKQGFVKPSNPSLKKENKDRGARFLSNNLRNRYADTKSRKESTNVFAVKNECVKKLQVQPVNKLLAKGLPAKLQVNQDSSKKSHTFGKEKLSFKKQHSNPSEKSYLPVLVNSEFVPKSYPSCYEKSTINETANIKETQIQVFAKPQNPSKTTLKKGTKGNDTRFLSSDLQKKFDANVKKKQNEKVFVKNECNKILAVKPARQQLVKGSLTKLENKQDSAKKSHTSGKENKLSPKNQHILDGKDMEQEFKADAFYRSLILSGKELSPSIMKDHPSFKLSSVVTERPSVYKTMELSNNPYRDALEAIQKASAKRGKNALGQSEPLRNSKLFSPFKTERPSVYKTMEVSSNPYRDALEAIQNASAKRGQNALGQPGPLPNSKLISPVKLFGRFSAYRTFERPDNPYKEAMKTLANFSASRDKKLADSKKSLGLHSSVDQAKPLIHKSETQKKVLKNPEVLPLGQPKPAKSSKKVTFNLEQDPPVFIASTTKEFLIDNYSNCPSSDIKKYVSNGQNVPSLSQTNNDVKHFANNEKNSQSIQMSFLQMQDPQQTLSSLETKAEDELIDIKSNEESENNTEDNGLNSPSYVNVTNGKLQNPACIFPLNRLHIVKSDDSVLPINSENICNNDSYANAAEVLLPSLTERDFVTTSNNIMEVCDELKDSLDKCNQPTITENNYICSIRKEINNPESCEHFHQKLFTPCPVSLHSQARSALHCSPEFLSESTIKLPCSVFPILTPLVLKHISRKLENTDLSPVKTKLDFPNDNENSEHSQQEVFSGNPRRVSIFSSTLQGVPTLSDLLDTLADQECSFLLFSPVSPVPYSRCLRNPIASILHEGDDMHFVPVYSTN